MNNHAEYEMFAIVLKIFQQYSINTNLLTITIDNAEFNNTLQQYFCNKIKQDFDYI